MGLSYPTVSITGEWRQLSAESPSREKRKPWPEVIQLTRSSIRLELSPSAVTNKAYSALSTQNSFHPESPSWLTREAWQDGRCHFLLKILYQAWGASEVEVWIHREAWSRSNSWDMGLECLPWGNIWHFPMNQEESPQADSYEELLQRKHKEKAPWKAASGSPDSQLGSFQFTLRNSFHAEFGKCT